MAESRSWQVRGAYAASGEDATMIVSAPDAPSAEALARANGLFVSCVVPLERGPRGLVRRMREGAERREPWASIGLIVLVLVSVGPIVAGLVAISPRDTAPTAIRRAARAPAAAPLPVPRFTTYGDKAPAATRFVGSEPGSIGGGLYLKDIGAVAAKTDLPDGVTYQWWVTMENWAEDGGYWRMYVEFVDKHGFVLTRAFHVKYLEMGGGTVTGFQFVPSDRAAEVAGVQLRLPEAR